jgi:hypothetical protein
MRLVRDGLVALAKFDAVSNAYIKNVFYLDPETAIGAERLNRVSKWLLDLLRNMIIVGGVQFLAKKAHSELLDLAAETALIILFAYCLSYAWRVGFRPFYCLKNQNLGKTLDWLANGTFWFLFTCAVVASVEFAVDRLVEAQSR